MDSMDEQSHNHTASSAATRRALWIAFCINTAFVFIELSGALYANSLTLLADGIHMITDSASIFLAILVSYIAMKSADKARTFGYHRVEVIGGLLNGIFLLGTVGYIIFDAYKRMNNPHPVNGEIVVLIGLLGLVANVSAAYVLHSEQHSINARGAYLHLIADALGSIAAIVSGVVISITSFYVVDIIFAVGISGLVLYSIKDLLSEAVHILLQGTPSTVQLSEVQALLYSIDGVRDVHHLHSWALKPDQTAVTVHLIISEKDEQTQILDAALTKLEEYGIDHPTVQIELEGFEQREHSCFKSD